MLILINLLSSAALRVLLSICAVPEFAKRRCRLLPTAALFHFAESSSLSLRPSVNVEDFDSDHERGGGEGPSNPPKILSQQDPKLTTLTVPVTPSAGRQR